MKKILLVLLFILMAFQIFLNAENEKKQELFDVSIMQDDKILEIKNDVVKLKHAPFKIIIKFKKKDGVYVNISHKEYLFEKAAANYPMNEIIGKDGIWMGGAEYPNNAKNDFHLQDDEKRWQYWYYHGKGENDSRFNSVIHENDSYVCTRIIENYYARGTYMPIHLYPFNELYLVFSHITPDEDYKNFKEDQTIKLFFKFIK